MSSDSEMRQLLGLNGLELESVAEQALCDVRSEASKEGPESYAGEVGSSMSGQRKARKS